MKYTYSIVKDYINSLGYDLLSEQYINTESKLKIVDLNRYYYFATLNNLKSVKKILFAHKTNPYSIQNIKQWLINNRINIELISDVFINKDEKILWKCLKCNEEFDMPFGYLLSGVKCPYRRGLRVGLSNCLATKETKLTSEWHRTKNGNFW